MKVLTLFSTLLAFTLAFNSVDQAHGQSIAQRRQRPGTYHHQSPRVMRPRIFYNVVPQFVQPQASTQSYRSFSFEPGSSEVEPADRTTEIPVFRTVRTSRRAHNHVGSIAQRRQHPGTN